MNDQELLDFAKLAEQVVKSGGPGGESIDAFLSTNTVAKCQFLLAQSHLPSVQTIAAKTLSNYIVENHLTIHAEDKYELRNFLVNLLTEIPVSFSGECVFILQLLCLITKVSWFDTVKDMLVFQQIIPDLQPLMVASLEQRLVGIHILAAMVDEMDLPVANFPKSRKVSFEFRDSCLLDIFTMALQELQNMTEKGWQEQDGAYLSVLLVLLRNCLDYDFAGTIADDTSDDEQTFMAPNTWKNILSQPRTLEVFFNLYSSFPPRIASMGMECVVLFAALRPSMFQNQQERKDYLTTLMVGIKSVYQYPDGLGDENTYHQFCRVLYRLKKNYQLTDLAAVEEYKTVIDMTAKFTIQSLQEWRWSKNSIHYLLSLWQKLVQSMAYTKSPAHYLEVYAPQIALAFITIHVDSVEPMLHAGDEDPFSNLDALFSELELFAVVGRCNYIQTGGLLLSYLSETGNSYRQLVEVIQQQAVAALGGETVSAIVNSVSLEAFMARKSAIFAFRNGMVGGSGGGGGGGGVASPANARYQPPQQRFQSSEASLSPIELTGAFYLKNLSIDIQNKLAVEEAKLTWLVFIAGALMNARHAVNANDQTDALDGEIACQILQVMSVAHVRAAFDSTGAESLEQSFLYCLKQIRKTYLTTDAVSNSSSSSLVAAAPTNAIVSTTGSGSGGSLVLLVNKFFAQAGAVEYMLNIVLNKVIHNLRRWARSDEIISKTSELFLDVGSAITSGTFCSRIEAVQFLVDASMNSSYEFLEPIDPKRRQVFFTALIRLALLSPVGNDDERLERFLGIFSRFFDELLHPAGAAVLGHSGDSGASGEDVLRLPKVQEMVVCLCRDLTGVVSALSKKSHYQIFFDWIYPDYLSTLIQALGANFDSPEVVSPILRFFIELSRNHNSRIQFDISSPNGILLFREISRVVCSYGTRVLTLVDISPSEIYPQKYKGIMLASKVLWNALTGNFVNFGTFGLYGDNALDSALRTFMDMLEAIPVESLMYFPKVYKTYFNVLDILIQDHMYFIVSLGAQSFMYIISTIVEGLKCTETFVRGQVSAAVDNMVSYMYRMLTKSKPSVERQHIERLRFECPDALPHVFDIMMGLVLYDNDRGINNIARPLLGLILLHPECFERVKQDFIFRESQPSRHAVLEGLFDSLMQGVDENLTIRNKERFNQKFIQFKTALKNPSLAQGNNASAGGSPSVFGSTQPALSSLANGHTPVRSNLNGTQPRSAPAVPNTATSVFDFNQRMM